MQQILNDLDVVLLSYILTFINIKLVIEFPIKRLIFQNYQYEKFFERVKWKISGLL